jgi:hypothetical protein
MMVVKGISGIDHFKVLGEAFSVMGSIGMKLNPANNFFRLSRENS